jgi:hypothetical protein
MMSNAVNINENATVDVYAGGYASKVRVTVVDSINVIFLETFVFTSVS